MSMDFILCKPGTTFQEHKEQGATAYTTMANKRNNANRKLQYSTPLPLPHLHHQQQLQQQQQLLQRQQTLKPCAAPTPTPSSPSPQCKSWTPLDALLDGIRSLYSWSKSEFAPSHPPPNLIAAEFHPQGESVWIQGDKEMSILFQQGFFGKGTLSRSEATWKQRNAKDAQGISLEDITRQRRIERAQQKKEKLLEKSVASSAASSPNVPPQAFSTMPSSSTPSSPLSSTSLSTTSPFSNGQSFKSTEDLDQEHLQLSLEEAFFLVFGIEVIEIKDSSSTEGSAMSIDACWRQFAQASVLKSCDQIPFRIEPGNPFVVRYVAYHFFRSQGWVVKDGLKYGVDFVLYQKGMVFGHSQYAVRVLPCYGANNLQSSDTLHVSRKHQGPIRAYMTPTPGLCLPHSVYSWSWLLSLNRIVSQVQKTLVVCHVVVPENITQAQLASPRTALPLYSVVEIGIKRFLPEKNRA